MNELYTKIKLGFEELKMGDLVMYKGLYNPKLAKLIQTYTDSQYTHCGIVISIEESKVVVAEAQSIGFTTITYDYPNLVEDPNLEFWRPKFALNIDELHKFVKDNKGKPYGWINYITIVLYDLFGWELFLDGTDSMVCSEAVARAYKLKFKKPYEFVTPEDIPQTKWFKRL